MLIVFVFSVVSLDNTVFLNNESEIVENTNNSESVLSNSFSDSETGIDMVNSFPATENSVNQQNKIQQNKIQQNRLSLQESETFLESIRVDYDFDNVFLYPDYFSNKRIDVMIAPSCNPSQCDYFAYYSRMGNLEDLDSYDTYVTVYLEAYVSGAWTLDFYIPFRFDITDMSGGTIYCNDCYRTNSGTFTAETYTVNIFDGDYTYTIWTFDLTSTVDYSTTAYEVVKIGSKEWLEGYWRIQATTTTGTGSKYGYFKIDQYYYSPDTEETYTNAKLTYLGNGQYSHEVVVNPSASATVKIFKSLDWTFSSASNGYDSASVVSDNLEITGLPVGQDTIVRFVSGYDITPDKDYTYSLYPYASWNETFDNYTFIHGGGSSYSTTSITTISANSFDIDAIQETLFVHFTYYIVDSLDTLLFSIWEWDVWNTKNLDKTENRWHSVWYSVWATGTGNDIFEISFTGSGQLYIGNFDLYRSGIYFDNNPDSNYDPYYYGTLYYLTDYGIELASNVQVNISGVNENFLYEQIITQTNELGYYYYDDLEGPYVIVRGLDSDVLPRISTNEPYSYRTLSGIQLVIFQYAQNPSINEFDNYFIVGTGLIGAGVLLDFLVKAFSDNKLIGYYESGDVILKETQAGSHTLKYQGVDVLCSMQGVDLAYQYEAAFSCLNTKASISSNTTINYSVIESNIETLIFRDDEGRFINPDTFNVYVDSSRVVGGSFYLSDTSQQFNLTITDAWETIIYQDITEDWIRIKDVTVTLRSVKTQNYLEDPIWIQIQRGSGATFSEWIFPQEVTEYYLLDATYTLTFNYADVDGNYESSTNGSYTSFGFTVSNDMAFRVTGKSLIDIYDQVISSITEIQDTQNQITNINASITDQVITVGISVTNINSTLSNQIVNIDISLDNTNSTLHSVLNSIDVDITNFQSNITVQLNDIDTTLTNINSSVFTQTNSIISNLNNVNSTIYAQTLSILNNLSISNSDIYSQTISILSNLSISNSVIYSQTVNILSQINAINSSLTSQTVSILNDINNLDSALTSQVVTIIGNITNSNSTLFDQTITILGNVANLDSDIAQQTLNIIGNITNINSTLYSQTVTVLSNIANLDSDLTIQTVSIIGNITNVNSTLYSQTISILADISNINSTLYGQTVSILSLIQQSNSTLFTQTVSILNAITNNDSLIYSQILNIATFTYLEQTTNFDIYETEDSIILYLSTNYRNSSVFVYDNLTGNIVYNGSEGFSEFSKNQSYGNHDLNITVQFSTGYELYYNFTYLVVDFTPDVDINLNNPPVTTVTPPPISFPSDPENQCKCKIFH